MIELKRKDLVLGMLYHMTCADGSTGHPFRVVEIRSDGVIFGRLYRGSRDDHTIVWTIENERTYLLPLADEVRARLEGEIGRSPGRPRVGWTKSPPTVDVVRARQEQEKQPVLFWLRRTKPDGHGNERYIVQIRVMDDKLFWLVPDEQRFDRWTEVDFKPDVEWAWCVPPDVAT